VPPADVVTVNITDRLENNQLGAFSSPIAASDRLHWRVPSLFAGCTVRLRWTAHN